ncbi:hypothetical protein DFH07DRAFT_783102 [Mycena maculata]|uniref:Uncharacterized protein n=1 Tax=Mycena maculata TaxID=230809 RepID=A0AAD7HQM0_9AGAR|nr:hypothetical protein DFH07DRAFT_783102 [Mycena maculata]
MYIHSKPAHTLPIDSSPNILKTSACYYTSSQLQIHQNHTEGRGFTAKSNCILFARLEPPFNGYSELLHRGEFRFEVGPNPSSARSSCDSAELTLKKTHSARVHGAIDPPQQMRPKTSLRQTGTGGTSSPERGRRAGSRPRLEWEALALYLRKTGACLYFWWVVGEFGPSGEAKDGKTGAGALPALVQQTGKPGAREEGCRHRSESRLAAHAELAADSRQRGGPVSALAEVGWGAEEAAEDVDRRLQQGKNTLNCSALRGFAAMEKAFARSWRFFTRLLRSWPPPSGMRRPSGTHHARWICDREVHAAWGATSAEGEGGHSVVAIMSARENREREWAHLNHSLAG